MLETRLINHKLDSTDVNITFEKAEDSNVVRRFSKTLSDIKETASYEDIYNAASAIAKLYDHDTFTVKLISSHSIQKDADGEIQSLEEEIETLEEVEEVVKEDSKTETE